MSLDVKSKNPLTYLSRVWRLRQVMRAEKPDLVCVHSRVPAWLYVGVRTLDSVLSRIKQSNNQTIKQSLPPWITYAHGANSVSRYSAVMTKGDLTVTPSRFLADFLKANYGLAEEKIRVIHPAADEKRFDPGRVDAEVVEARRRAWGLAPDDFVVMAVGRITPVKGYDALVRAVARLAPRLPNLKLVLVGDADRRHAAHLAELKALVGELGLERTVVFAGGESKVPECLTLASVVVSSNTKKPESFGLSLVEALMMGKPVVAKAFGGACEIVRDGVDGLLAPDDDFAGAIEEVGKARFSARRDDAVRRFGLEVLREKTVSLYEECRRT